jgi:hypothetical protein
MKKLLALSVPLVLLIAALSGVASGETGLCGTDGYRVQAIYAVASDQLDRYGTVAPQIAQHQTVMDAAVDESAAQQGGTRLIRWVCGVAHVTLSPAGDDSYNNVSSELRAQGFLRPDRKYLVWLDAPGCGISAFGGSMGMVGTGCWDRTDHSTPLHELLHLLGAVSWAAPHSDSSGHCADDSDIMCYGFTHPCPDSNERLLDCNHDDYFDVTGQLDPALNVADEPYFWPNTQPNPSPSPSPCMPRGKSGKCK